MYLRKSIMGTASMLGLAGILAFSGCSSDSDQHAGSGAQGKNGEHAVGNLGLGLLLPDGSDVNNPTYTITRTSDPTFTRTGTLAIGSGGVASTTITGLVPGSDYHVSIVATRTRADNAAASDCTGSANFTVVASQTTVVNVIVQCDDSSPDTGNVTINGTFNICPKIGSTSATPASAEVGSSIAITASATDKDGDTLTYAWSASSGTFSPASAANTSYTCAAAGSQVLTLTVTDGASRGCTKTAMVTVTCTSTTVVDSGTPVVDSGTPEVDSGTPEVDSGTPQVDSGMTQPDSGMTQPDGGTGGRSAACTQCLNAQCTNYLGELPVLQDCSSALCQQIVTCAEQAHLVTSTLDVTKPYCGDVSFDDCNVAAYVPNGPCKALMEQGMETTVKDTVLERYIDPSYEGGKANYLITCEADLCASQCLL